MDLDVIQAIATIMGLPVMAMTWWDTRKARLSNVEFSTAVSGIKQARICLRNNLVTEIFKHKLKIFFSIFYIIITSISVIVLMITRDGINYNEETGFGMLRVMGYYIFVGFSCLYFWVWISVNWGRFSPKESSQASLAWESGEIARYDNLSVESNPYKPDNPLCFQWLEGWNSVNKQSLITEED